MPEFTSELSAAVTNTVIDSWQRVGAEFAIVGPELDDLFTVGIDLLRHGKRLRAAFAALGWRGVGGPALATAEVRLGAGLELFQMAALVHDDLMDGSQTRRGRPAAHRQFISLHHAQSLLGDAESFGSSAAVLLGDLLLVAASSELDAAITLGDPQGTATARALVSTMMAEVTVGQYLDIVAQSAPWSSDPSVDLNRAQRVIRAKSARYSVEHPLTIGAAMAGADQPTLEVLAQIGLPIGEAFQLRDDLLGVFGDPHITGKPAGDDLREGKRTVLVTLAMTRATGPQRAQLQEAIGQPDLTAADIDDVRGILTTTGAVDEVESLISQRFETAMATLSDSGLPAHTRRQLASLARAAVTRSA